MSGSVTGKQERVEDVWPAGLRRRIKKAGREASKGLVEKLLVSARRTEEEKVIFVGRNALAPRKVVRGTSSDRRSDG